MQSTCRVWKRRTTSGKHNFANTFLSSGLTCSVASKSSFPHILRMVLAQMISKISIPVLTQPFERIPLSSQQTRQRTGGLKARNLLPLASLWSNARPKYRPGSTRSRPVVELRQRRTKRRTKNNFLLTDPSCVILYMLILLPHIRACSLRSTKELMIQTHVLLAA